MSATYSADHWRSFGYFRQQQGWPGELLIVPVDDGEGTSQGRGTLGECNDGVGETMIDDLDRRLIDLLGRDGRRSFTSLAEELGVAQSTVRGRLAKLQDDDVVSVVGICNALLLGHQVARLLLRVRNLTPQAVADDLAANNDIHHVALISGSHDIYLEATCRDQAQLINLLDDIRCTPGVTAIQPILVTSLAKDYTWHGLRGAAGQSVSNPDA